MRQEPDPAIRHFRVVETQSVTLPNDLLNPSEGGLPRRFTCRFASIARQKCFYFRGKMNLPKTLPKASPQCLHFCTCRIIESPFKIHAAILVQVTPMASTLPLAARQTYTLALCPPEIIETCKETTGNIHGNERDYFSPINKSSNHRSNRGQLSTRVQTDSRFEGHQLRLRHQFLPSRHCRNPQASAEAK